MVQFNKQHLGAILGEEAGKGGYVNRMTLQKKLYQNKGVTPMHLACINPDPSMLRKYFKVNPTAKVADDDQRDLIHYAAANKGTDCLQFLIDKKSDMNQRDAKGMTPLMIACKLGRIENVGLLLQEGQRQLDNLDKKDPDFDSYSTYFKYATSLGPKKNTPLHYAAQSGYTNIVKALIDFGALPDAKNTDAQTALTLACDRGHLETAEYLINAGANIHGIDKQKRSPLIRACLNGQIHIVAMLLRKGVNPNL